MDNNNPDDVRLMEQYQLGNAALKAQNYFDSWIEKKREFLIRNISNAEDESSIIPLWQKLKVLNELEKDIKRDVQTGEIALDEMEKGHI